MSPSVAETVSVNPWATACVNMGFFLCVVHKHIDLTESSSSFRVRYFSVMNAPAVAPTKEGRLIDHGNAIQAAFDAFLRRTLLLPVASALVIDISQSAALQQLSDRAATSSPKNELRFVDDLPKTYSLVPSADADRSLRA